LKKIEKSSVILNL